MAADRSRSTSSIVPLVSPWAATSASSTWASTSTMADPTVTTSRLGSIGSTLVRSRLGDLLLPLVQCGDEVVVGAGEGVDALPFDRLRQVVVIDAGRRQPVHHRPGAVDVGLDGVGLGVAVVPQGLDRRRGQRVDGVAAHELVDVERV